MSDNYKWYLLTIKVRRKMFTALKHADSEENAKKYTLAAMFMGGLRGRRNPPKPDEYIVLECRIASKQEVDDYLSTCTQPSDRLPR